MFEWYGFWIKLLLKRSIWTGRFWSNQLSLHSDFSASPSWRAKYLSPKEIFWFPLLSQDYFIIQIGWLWLDLNTKKWFARPNLSLIKNGWYYHYQWQINYQLRPKDEKMSNLRNLFCMVAIAFVMIGTGSLEKSVIFMTHTRTLVSIPN